MFAYTLAATTHQPLSSVWRDNAGSFAPDLPQSHRLAIEAASEPDVPSEDPGRRFERAFRLRILEVVDDQA